MNTSLLPCSFNSNLHLLRASRATARRCRHIQALIFAVVGVVVGEAGSLAEAGPFSNGCPASVFPSSAGFRIVRRDGVVMAASGLNDLATVIGRSDPFCPPDIASGVAAICLDTNLYPDMLRVVDLGCGVPLGWPIATGHRTVMTEMLSLNLAGNGMTIRAGQPFFNSVAGTPRRRWFRHSVGAVISDSSNSCSNVEMDFPARSFFNVFVEVEVPGLGRLYNKSTMTVKAVSIDEFPPRLHLPQSVYIHDPEFGAVDLFDEKGLFFGWLATAGHGATNPVGGGSNPLPLPGNAQRRLISPASFAVDVRSGGLNPSDTGTGNDVYADAGMTTEPLTVYLSSGQSPGGPPDTSNARQLVGGAGGAPGAFAVGDGLNSISYGRDGNFPEPMMNLYFSVTRASQGAACTDVRDNATIQEVGADIYASMVLMRFGAYIDMPEVPARPSSHVLACDNTALGLGPSLVDTNHDELTGLELSSWNQPPGRLLFATYTGPSFVGRGADIYVYDPASGPLENARLQLYASAAQLGLNTNDVIDALALSDVSDGGAPIPDGVYRPGEDEIFFSLAAGSPSLPSMGSAADVFYRGFRGNPPIRHTQLGLLENDDLDALDLKPVNGPGGAPQFIDGLGTTSPFTNYEGQTATLRLPVAGQGLQYQWRKGSVPIADAILPYLTLPRLRPSDAGSYRLLVSNSVGFAVSSSISMFVLADREPPRLIGACSASNRPTAVTVTFSEPVEAMSAEARANYTLTRLPAGSSLTISNAVLVSPAKVFLTTQPLAPGAQYRLAVTGVTDTAVARNVIALSAASVSTPGLAISLENNAVVVGWCSEEEATLESSQDVTGPYRPVLQSRPNDHSVPTIAAPQEFFRLRSRPKP